MVSKIQCGQCGVVQTKMRVCSKCKEISYCSRDCQKKAWKVHKQYCIAQEKQVFYNETSISEKSFSKDIHTCFKNYERFLNLSLKFSIEWFSASKKAGIAESEEHMNQLVIKRDLKTLLLYIWTEKDLSYLATWLKNTVKKWPHPLFYLKLKNVHLSLAKKQRKPLRKQELYSKAVMYKFVSTGLIQADVSCFLNQEFTDLATLFYKKLLEADPEEPSLVQKEEIFFKRVLDLLEKEKQYLLENIHLLSSPQWVAGKVAMFFPLIPTLPPPKVYKAIRRDFLENRLIVQ